MINIIENNDIKIPSIFFLHIKSTEFCIGIIVHYSLFILFKCPLLIINKYTTLCFSTYSSLKKKRSGYYYCVVPESVSIVY